MKVLSTLETEQAAINCFWDRLLNTKHLLGDFMSNDKTPCIDGKILFVEKKKKNLRKKDYLGKVEVPVQIKGKLWKQEDFPSTHFYDLSVEDLKYYQEIGGTTLIVVLIKESDFYDRKIYYKNISGLEARKLLLNKNSSRQRIGVIPLPPDNYLDNLFFNFAQDVLYQKNSDPINPDEINSLTQNYGYSIVNPIYGFDDSEIFPEDVPLYQKNITSYLKSSGPGPIKWIPFSHDPTLSELKEGKFSESFGPVKINDVEYFDEAIQIWSEDKIILKVGIGLTLVTLRNGGRKYMELDLHGTLAEQIIDLDFWIKMIDNNGFMVGENFIEIPEDLKDKYLTDFKEAFDKRNKLVYPIIFLNLKDKFNHYPLEKFNGKPLLGMIPLVEDIYNHTVFKIPEREFFPLGIVPIGECQFIMALKKEGQNEFRIETFQNFNEKIVLNNLNCSKYGFLTPSMLNKLWNISSNDLLDFLKKIPKDEWEAREMKELIIRLIQAYDISNEANSHFLDIVKESLNWRYKNNDSFLSFDFFKTSLIQISKRRGNILSEEDKKYLISLQNNPIKDKEFRFIASGLLDQVKGNKKNLKALKELEKNNPLIKINPAMLFVNKKRYIDNIFSTYEPVERILGLA